MLEPFTITIIFNSDSAAQPFNIKSCIEFLKWLYQKFLPVRIFLFLNNDFNLMSVIFFSMGTSKWYRSYRSIFEKIFFGDCLFSSRGTDLFINIWKNRCIDKLSTETDVIDDTFSPVSNTRNHLERNSFMIFSPSYIHRKIVFDHFY